MLEMSFKGGEKDHHSYGGLNTRGKKKEPVKVPLLFSRGGLDRSGKGGGLPLSPTPFSEELWETDSGGIFPFQK